MVQPQQLLACSRYQQADEVKQIEFHNSKASAVMGDLSAEETMAVATWFMAKTGAAPFRASPSIEKWLAGPSAVELLRPPQKRGTGLSGWQRAQAGALCPCDHGD